MIELPLKSILPNIEFEEHRFIISLQPSGVTLDLKDNVYIMGVLNVSPESFYIGYSDSKEALKAAEKLISDGADIIDVGGQSSRPGADEIQVEEEKRRIKIIKKIRELFPKTPISIDTYRSEVAELAFELGADMLNDISGFRFDPRISDICTKYKAPAVIMHTTAKPKEMQEKTIQDDENLINTIKNHLLETAKEAEMKNIKVIIDPGIGFGKKPHQNLIILNRIGELVKTGYPVLIGASRKSFIGYCLSPQNPLPPSERLEGTIAASVIAVQRGARILRVHDVKENIRALKVLKSIVSERFDS